MNSIRKQKKKPKKVNPITANYFHDFHLLKNAFSGGSIGDNNLNAEDEALLHDTLKAGLYNYETSIDLSDLKDQISYIDVENMIYTKLEWSAL